jgi:hypothetical protein
MLGEPIIREAKSLRRVGERSEKNENNYNKENTMEATFLSSKRIINNISPNRGKEVLRWKTLIAVL